MNTEFPVCRFTVVSIGPLTELTYSQQAAIQLLTENAKRFADPASGKLELEAVLDGLLIDGLIDESNSALLRSISKPGSNRNAISVLERIAASGWTHARDKTQAIDLDFLT
ncbi:MAG: hypothetical protein KTR32_32175, partial [Granulosicoccus sp.]|nr:hypothetical protein [Granulosicoccus sp.]